MPSLLEMVSEGAAKDARYAMRKQNYQQFAAVLREIDAGMAMVAPLPPDVHNAVMEHVCSRIAMLFAKDNPAFDSFRFYEATGIARFRDDVNYRDGKSPPQKPRSRK